MSKPLILVLQLVGIFMFFSGYIAEPKDVFKILIGVALVVVGGVALRSRNKKSSS